MAETSGSGEQIGAEAVSNGVLVRRLLRAARAGYLATQSDGQPFASLITPAMAPDLSILMFITNLSEHTRQLMADPRCALLVHGAAESANPQTAPRATITGLAERVEDAALMTRWLAIHPYAELYAGFADFGLWRIVPRGASFIGGFARAARPRLAELLPPAEAVAAVAAAEQEIIVHCNNDHPDTIALITAAAGHGAAAWRMVVVDIDGFDASDGQRVVRIDWPGPVSSAEGIRAQLIRLAKNARP